VVTQSLSTERIVYDVYARVALDRDRLRDEIKRRFAGGTRNDLIEAEQVATAVVGEAWGEVGFDCERALSDVHELYLLQSARVLEAQDELRRRGSDSWIARSVVHEFAAQLAWDVLDERGLLAEL